MLSREEIINEYKIAKESGIHDISDIGAMIIKYHMDELIKEHFDDNVCFIMDTIMFHVLDEVNESLENVKEDIETDRFDRAMQVIE